jgi:hypothetical protein
VATASLLVRWLVLCHEASVNQAGWPNSWDYSQHARLSCQCLKLLLLPNENANCHQHMPLMSAACLQQLLPGGSAIGWLPAHHPPSEFTDLLIISTGLCFMQYACSCLLLQL